mmetsp:Transcript_10214/g.16960  ORF Transcript_10214/g.16960 Transcript_10214/m.16960 type:complete len:203 (+) Transcript_10214:128-736(+)
MLASSRCSSSSLAMRYSLSMSVSITMVRFRKSHDMPTTSVPANQVASALARLVKMTIPCTNESAATPSGTVQILPTPILSSPMLPSAKNSATGRPTKAYFSPLNASGSLRGVRTSKKAGRSARSRIDALKPSISGYTSRCLSSNQDASSKVQRDGLATTSTSERAILIMLNMAPRKKRIVCGLISLSSMASSTTRRTSLEFT